MKKLFQFLSITALALLVGCAGTPKRSDDSVPAPWPEFAPPGANETVYRIDHDSSELRIRVDPEGPIARLGHSHVIGGLVISGTVVTAQTINETRLDLRIDAAALEVDRPEWRAAEGLEPELDESTISGTLANMQGDAVLAVRRHPEISIRSIAVDGPVWLPDLTVRIRLRGVVREVVVPVAVTHDSSGLSATGAFDLLQSDFGIEPFSTAAGALRVSDRMQIRFRIVARNEGPQ